MEEIVSYLKQSGVQYFATVGLDGRPKVRPFQFMFEENNKLWFCTSNRKKVYNELQEIPFVEICSSGGVMSWMRLEGKAIFSDSSEIKQKVFEVSPIVKGIYKDHNNPSFEVFYLEEITATISEIGKDPKVYTF